MGVTLSMQGLEEFRQALRRLPDDLATEAGDIVIAHAEEAQQQIRAAYPTGPTGNLKRGVRIERNRSTVSTRAIVKSVAKHAHLFEFGTTQRTTRRGANRGRMPKAPDTEAMIPIAIRARRKMTAALIAMLVANGFEVTQS